MFIEINIQKVAKQIFESPTEERSIRELAKLAGISPATTSKACRKLKTKNIIQTKKVGRSNIVTANIENEEYKFYKKIYNLLSIKELSDELKKENPLAIILYGSYARGEDTEESDIDIAIVGKEPKIDKQKHEKKLKRKIHIITFQSEKKIPKELNQNLKNGLVLYGGLL